MFVSIGQECLILTNGIDFNNGEIVDLMGDYSVEKVIQTKMMIDALNSALKKLTKEER